MVLRSVMLLIVNLVYQVKGDSGHKKLNSLVNLGFETRNTFLRYVTMVTLH